MIFVCDAEVNTELGVEGGLGEESLNFDIALGLMNHPT